MTRDDIIRMAVQCQLVTTANRDGIYMDALSDFAALVAAAEREACAKLCEAGIDMWPNEYHEEWNDACEDRAKSIRARGQA